MLKRKHVTKSFQDQTKEKEVVEDTSPTLLINQASTSTIREAPITVYMNYRSPQANKNNPNTD